MSATVEHQEGYFTDSRLVSERIKVVLVGAGGTGGEMLDRLVRLHFGLIKTGHPGGLHVTLVDGDEVSEANIGRQRFSPLDIGSNKADILIHRANIGYGLDWVAHPEYIERHQISQFGPDLLITCTDKASFRADVGRYTGSYFGGLAWGTLWLDTGNDKDSGQVILGHLSEAQGVLRLKGDRYERLPNVYDLYPELKDQEDDDEPSCSFEEAIAKQDLTINPLVADLSANLIWQMLRHGHIDHHGYRISLKDGKVTPLKIDLQTWGFFGYTPERMEGEPIPF